MRRTSAASLLVIAPALALWVVSTSPAWADDEDNVYARPGLYLGASPLVSVQNFDFDSKSSIPLYETDIETVSEGLILRLGYRLDENLAVELDAEWLNSFAVSLGNTGSVKEIDRIWAVTPSVRGILPLGRFEPYFRLGLGYVSAQFEENTGPSSGLSDVDDGAGVFAVGLDMYLVSRIAFTVEGEYYQSFRNQLNWGSVSAGLTVRFGS